MADLSYMDCPVIDLSLLSSSSSSTAIANEHQKLLSALNTWGCFQLVNHGISGEFLEEIREVSKKFFWMPKEEKEKVGRRGSSPQGYGSDSIVSDDHPLQWNSRLFLTLLPKDQRKLDRWPYTPHNFREVLEELSSKVKRAHDALVKAMARSLGLEENIFKDEYGDESMQMISRFNYYPPCPYQELVRKSSQHADSSALTFLVQDNEVEGLEILKDDQWYKVSIIPHALFINVGDQMEIMSNGILKSAIHRVLANPEKERISIATFCGPDPEKEIGPVKGLVTQDKPALYKRVKRYGEIFFRYHPTGVRPLTAVQISNS